jgi:hypothetical protein
MEAFAGGYINKLLARLHALLEIPKDSIAQ